MTGRYSVLRGASKLKDVDEKIQKLFNEKHVRIVKAQEEEEEEAEQVENDLLATIAKLAIKNAEDIMKITEQEGFSLPKEKKNKEENLETLTKSLESISGVPLKAVVKGRRRRIE
ncbi:hypothetical protein ES707_16958 [subsurface metagenome]